MRIHLTPGDERILNYLAGGLHDAEIAVRLGLPVAGVRSRIDDLVARGGFEDRPSLLRWHRKYAGARSGRPMDRIASQLRRWPVVLAAFAVAGVVVSIGLAALSSPDDAADPLPAAPSIVDPQESTPSPTERLRFETPGPTPAGAFQPGEISLGAGEALLLTATDESGDITRVVRVYRDPTDGEATISEEVWTAPPGFEVASLIADPSGWQLAIVSRPRAVDGNTVSELIVGTVGALFEPPLPLPPGYFPVFFAGRDVVIAPTSTEPAHGWLRLGRDSGALESIAPPAAVNGGPVGWIPDSGLVWPSGGGDFINSDGTSIMHIEVSGIVPTRINGFVYFDDDGFEGSQTIGPGRRIDLGVAVVSWLGDDGNDYTSSIWLPDGAVVDALRGPMRVRGLGNQRSFTGEYCPAGACRPAIFRFGAGFAWVYRDLDRTVAGRPGESNTAGDPRLIGTQRGPFARVRADLDECAPFYSGPAETAACAPTGSSLALAGLTSGPDGPAASIVEGDGTRYLRVYTPEGEAGLIDVRFIEFRETFPDLRLR